MENVIIKVERINNMWDIEEAKSLIELARETDSVLTHKLADYLGYAIATIEYYKSLFDEDKNHG